MTAQVVVFDYTTWAQRYPEFVANAAPGKMVTEPLASLYFAEAELYVDNTPRSPVCNLTQRTAFLYMITAHIAALNGPGATPIVGRVSDATEGSVSVSTDMETPKGAEWFMQTKYGAAYWQASGQFRRAFYVSPTMWPSIPFAFRGG